MDVIREYKKLNTTVKATLWYFLCSIVQKGIMFITIPLYVRLLTAEQYGNYSVFVSWRDILIIPITLNLHCGFSTKAMVDFDRDRDCFISSVQGLGTVITLLYFAIFLCFPNLWMGFLGTNGMILSLLFGYYVTFPAYSLWNTRQRVEYRYKKMVFVTVALSVFTPALSLALLFLTDFAEEGVIIGTLLAQIVFGSYFYCKHFLREHTFYKKDYWFQAVKYNIPLIPHYLSLIVLAQADRIMIRDMCGSDKAGIYSLAYQMASLVNIIVNAIGSAIVPWLYGELKARRYTETKKLATTLCVFMGGIAVVAMLLAPEIVVLIGTNEYLGAIWIIPSVALSAYLSFCNDFFTAVEFYYSKTKYVMAASTVGAAVNIILNYFFIGKYGYIAAGYTTLACYTLFFFAHYYCMRRICKAQLDNEKIYDDKTIMLIVAIMFILMFGCLAIYGNPYVRYCICAGIILLVLIFREGLTKTARNLIG